MKDYEKLINDVEFWAEERGLQMPENASKQMLKLQEEVGELTQAFLKGYSDKFTDSIGDIQVVLIILCMQQGVNYHKCLEDAYNVIKERKGKLVAGSYIKESDITN